LSANRDYYFCDGKRSDEERSFFTMALFDRFLGSKQARAIGDSLYEIDPDAFFDFSLRRLVSRISTVVYRRSVAPALTFEPPLRVANEDCFFLLQLIQKCQRICCSALELLTSGQGVNIYQNSLDWDNPRSLARLVCEIRAYRHYLATLSLSKANKRFVIDRARFTRKQLAYFSIRYVLQHRALWPSELVDMIRDDVRFWAWYPFYAACVVVEYPLRLYDPYAPFKIEL
jgi:hypothetical protein